VTTIGKGQSPANNSKVMNVNTGNVVDPNALDERVHRIPVCAGT